MSTASLQVPCIDSSSNATSVFGGLTAVWTEEGGTLSSDEPAFGRVRLQAKKLTLTTFCPNELLMDSGPALDVWLRALFSEALAWYEDTAFLTGSGVGQPLGVLNSAALVTVAKETGQVADTIVWENILKMHARMLPSSHHRAVWVVSQTCLPELGTMSVSVGTGGSAIWLLNGAGGAPVTILGRPVLYTEKVPPVGGAGSGKDISYLDLGYYLIGDRMQMTLEASPHARFTNDETVFRGILRCDGRPSILSAITPANGSDTLSPFVTLAER
jgi:HK97 family phage major capsid protein